MTNTNHRQAVWLALLATLLLAFTPKVQALRTGSSALPMTIRTGSSALPMTMRTGSSALPMEASALPMAEEADDLQAYLDQIAAGQQAQPAKKSPRKAEGVEIPVGLTEVDLSKFTSYQNRTKQLTIKASVKFTNGTITAAATYSGGGSLLKVYGGATVVLDATAGVNAGSTTTSNCLAAVGIYEGSTFYQCGDITAPDNGAGIAIYLDTSADAYYYVSGTTKGTISNEKHGTVVGVDEDYQFKDGETFTAPTVENVTMTFQVISASEKTCRVGIGSAAAIATSTQGVVTIPGKVKGLTVTTISNRAFKECQALTRVVIPGTVTTIGTTDFDAAMGAFHCCSSITSFDIPSSVTLIGRGTFSGCVSVTSFTLPSSVTTLGSCAFDGCSGLKSVELSPNIKSIEMQTFRYCSSLLSIVIPAAITSFGGSAFTGCNNLTSITSLVTTPFSFGSDVFSNYNARLYVPAGTKATYQATACWNRFTHIYTIGSNEEKEDLQAQLAAIGQRLDRLSSDLDEATTMAATVKATLGESEQTAAVDATLAQLRQSLESLRSAYNALVTKVNNAQTSELAALQSQVDALQQQVSEWDASLQTLVESTKATVVNLVQTELTTAAADLTALQTAIVTNRERVAYIESQTGTGFFMRQSTEAFTAQLGQAKAAVNDDAQQASTLVGTFNSTFNNVTISTVEQALALYENYQAIVGDIASLKTQVAATTATVSTLGEAFDALPVVFPDEDVAWSLRPSGLKDELQAGYKSNRGFVLTSAGMMYFEQVSGATFHLRDADDHYLTATTGTATLRTATKAEATVWTGQSLGNGSYVFRNSQGAYLSYSGIQVNNAVTASTTAYAWQIEEGIDELQAFLNLLAEEESENGGSDLQPTDTLYVVLPTVPPGDPVPTTPFVFPKVNYPVVVTGGDDGYWPIPAPKPGQPRPADYHPVYIPKGSHVIIDDVTFYDIVGGDHVIYVEGTVEININVLIHVTNWEWFIHVGPGGQVIWRPTGDGGSPRIKNEGTMNVYAHVDYILNTGTLNHYQGTVTHVVNRYIYYFYGGVVNLLWNYGQHFHQGGTALTARNFQGATYTMTGGEIRNTVVSQTDTVFVNHGTFHFRGGTIGGYGSRLIYHGPGATMYIDGGHFDFTYVVHYWIEAHNYFYIRGDYNYGATVPMLLNPGVTIRLLYNWTYRFNIQFIGNIPRSHYPLFWADGFTLTRNHFVFINWTLPGSRWRWYLDEAANTIEPRGEEVEDEDDLQAWLDWLAEHQDDDAASSEEQPQELDLKGRAISITKPVELPTGTHLLLRNGTLRPAGTWAYSYVIYAPVGITLRLDRTVIGTTLWSDVWVYPGAAAAEGTHGVYITTERRICITHSLTYTLRLYFSVKDFVLGQPLILGGEGYTLTADDCKRMVIDLPEGYEWQYSEARRAVVVTSKGDSNNDDTIDVADIATIISYMAGHTEDIGLEQADANGDGTVDVADIATVISLMAGR